MFLFIGNQRRTIQLLVLSDQKKECVCLHKGSQTDDGAQQYECKYDGKIHKE